jgi:hypothetical protein
LNNFGEIRGSEMAKGKSGSGKGSGGGKRGRDAGNGQFIPVAEAERRKNTAVVETIKPSKKK